MAQRRHAVVVTHTRLRETSLVVREAVDQLRQVGFEITMIDELKARKFGDPAPQVDDDTEIVVVLGGDGTILGAAELVHGTSVPILGVNLGHVGFLAEFESFQLREAIRRVADHDYSIDERMLASVSVISPQGQPVASDWALNDIAIQQDDRDHMLELSVGVDGVETSSFGCDGVVVSTPTGSTAYAFSAGGPIIWPNVKALQLIPLAAHALFTRPLIIGDGSTFSVDILPDSTVDGSICCDGRRKMRVPKGSRVTVHVSPLTLRLASLSGVPFTNRLVKKFNLPSVSLRERARREERLRERAIAKGEDEAYAASRMPRYVGDGEYLDYLAAAGRTAGAGSDSGEASEDYGDDHDGRDVDGSRKSGAADGKDENVGGGR
ncbi:NAD kinase [Bifidobacterium sp. ESL0763]|uniref:NAD kinase n=1 Tax=Bifidobacterium sp. ESL0763 TaxID=2983227 RepID=UPI0027E03D33|nr:NAD kinase [Bifidobacterium sp. ESL0763]